jgi:putative photosynthetic complex assembly protein 2
MGGFVAPALYALLIWWVSTAAIILLDNLPRRTFRWSLAGGTVLLGYCLLRLWTGRDDVSAGGVYAAFTCAVLAWGWQEMTFFMGAITGPRRVAADPEARGWRLFRQATGACLWHELAIAATAGVIALLTLGGANRVGLYTFLLLWGMRQSAKLNFFLGVLNIGEQFLPAHLRYLRSYMRKRPMNLLMPISVTAGTALTAVLAWKAAQPGAGEAGAVGFTALATMSALGVIEHWMLITPIPFDRLWNWVLRLRRPDLHLPGAATPTRYAAAKGTSP